VLALGLVSSGAAVALDDNTKPTMVEIDAEELLHKLRENVGRSIALQTEQLQRAASAMAAVAQSAPREPRCRRREIVLERDVSAGVPEIAVAKEFVTVVNILDGKGGPRRIGAVESTDWLWASAVGHVLNLSAAVPRSSLASSSRNSSVAVLLEGSEEHPEVLVLASKVGGKAVDCWVDLRLAAE